jgi:serine/threonine-protein kinase
MGEVYKARDTRLDRTVAIKVLPPHIAADPDVRQRFEREAKAIAALNHPTICTLYDVGREQDADFLVMEHLEGESLAERLERGALPLDEALRVATQVAAGLDTAHRHGIVHRDLKPGNVMLTKGGAKLLDFGLAKVGPTESTPAYGVTTAATQAGTVLGTFHYMAPEQLEGKEADARTDLFAFGVMLYEMVTGRRAFTGDSQAGLITAIMTAQPESLTMGATAFESLALQRLVTVCLEKDPDERWQSAGDLRRELVWIAGGSGGQPTGGGTAPLSPVEATSAAPEPAWRRWLPWGLAATAMLVAVGAWTLRPRVDPGRTHVSIGVQPAGQLGGASARVFQNTLALSADGVSLVFVGAPEDSFDVQLYRRDLHQPEAVPIPGTEGAAQPMLSPDGRWVGFTVARRLFKVDAAGGLPVEIIELRSRPRGVHWTAADTIVFGQQNGIFQVSADGGAPERLTEVDRSAEEYQHTLPRMLPGGEAVLYTVQRALFRWEDADIVVQRIDTGERTVVVEGGADARYVDTGHLVFVRSGTLMAVPFDLNRLEVTGGEVSLVDGVTQAINVLSSDGDTGAAQFQVSAGGHLVYLPGGIAPDTESTVSWLDRDGNVARAFDDLAAYGSVRLSPTGERLAYTTTGSNAGVWVRDLRRGVTTQLSDGQSSFAIWTRDGEHVTFDRVDSGVPNLYWRVADASRPAEPLATSDAVEFPAVWSADDRRLIYSHNGSRLSVLHVEEGRREELFGHERPAMTPALSPDGRWLAYASFEAGSYQVFVRPFPGPGGRTQISVRGGLAPSWSADGRELFFLTQTDAQNQQRYMMRVDVALEPTPVVGRPARMFEWDHVISTPVRRYDVASDGRFLIAVAEDLDTVPRGHVRLIDSGAGTLVERVPAR